MKKIVKNSDGKFICEDCGQSYGRLCDLSRHINAKHDNIENYYNRWIFEKDDNACKICTNTTVFISLSKGFKNTCSKECGDIYSWEMTKKSNIEKYGQCCILHRKDIHEKSRVTMKAKYGGEYSSQSKILMDKMKSTMKDKYGVEYAAQNQSILAKQQYTRKQKYKNGVYNEEKFRQTNMERYGVEYPQQNKEIFKKSQKTLFNVINYKNLDISYQASYELDFLEKFYDKIDIENGPSIPYLFEGNNKVYHSDFYIPSLNLVIEIKNSYLFKKDIKKIKEKEKATISNGFNYIIIIDKNYNEFLSQY